MSDKEPVVDEVVQFDDYPPMEEGARKAEFLAGIEIALEQARRGEGISVEEARKLVKEWARQ